MARTAQYTRQLSLLVSDDTKAFLLGSAEVEQESEAEVTRTLLDRAITEVCGVLGQQETDRRVELGRQVLARRGVRDGG